MLRESVVGTGRLVPVEPFDLRAESRPIGYPLIDAVKLHGQHIHHAVAVDVSIYSISPAVILLCIFYHVLTSLSAMRLPDEPPVS